VLRQKPPALFGPPNEAAPGVMEGQQVRGAGAKVLLPAAVRLAGHRDLIHYWIGLPTGQSQEALEPAGSLTEAYALVVDVTGRSPADSDPADSRIPLYPVYAVAWEKGLPVYYLCPIREYRSGFDTLGESGQEHPAAVFVGALRTWRSNAAAAPGAYEFIPVAGARTPGPWYSRFSERHLPAPPGVEESRRQSPVRLLLACLTGFLLLAGGARALRKIG
jgi:hypothetical protein